LKDRFRIEEPKSAMAPAMAARDASGLSAADVAAQQWIFAEPALLTVAAVGV
jgi:hypothetical protein